MSCPAKVYRPRTPQKTALYQVIDQNLSLFLEVYDEQFLNAYGPLRKTAQRSLEKYLRCGILRYGFGRARCFACQRDLLIAYSCQKRGVCPSCAAKRIELLCAFVQESVLERVAHRQFVFVLPKRFRLFFWDAPMRTLLCRSTYRCLQKFLRLTLDRPQAKPGVICLIQSFGEQLNPHLHLHCLVAEGGFDAAGQFHPLSLGHEEMKVLQALFAGLIFRLLLKAKRIPPILQEQMKTWTNYGGFSVDASVRILPQDKAGLSRLLRYMARPCISQDRLTYDRATGQVCVYSSKEKHRILAKHPALEFLALLSLQVPPKGSHLVRYYGHYATRTRLKRKRTQQQQQQTPAHGLNQPLSFSRKALRKRWAELLRQVLEVNPLTCSSCHQPMKLVAFIHRPKDIEAILDSLRIPLEELPATGPPAWFRASQARAWCEENQDCLAPDDPLQQEEVPMDAYLIDPIYGEE